MLSNPKYFCMQAQVTPLPSFSDVQDSTAAQTPAADPSDWRIDLPEPLIESECGADYIPLLTALKLGRCVPCSIYFFWRKSAAACCESDMLCFWRASFVVVCPT
jgi:hypothetical protein